MHVFKHPKYYQEYNRRAKKFQEEEKARKQSSSNKPVRNKPQATNAQATSSKIEVLGPGAQASSHKHQAPGF